MVNMFKLIISIVVITIVTSSCNTNSTFNQSVELPSSGWYKNNAVAFNVDVADSLSSYKFALNVRNNTKKDRERVWKK